MTNKDYNALSSRKLEALFEVATEKEQPKIRAVLDARAQTHELDEGGNFRAPCVISENDAPAVVDTKLSDDEVNDIVDDLRPNIGHMCNVVPFNEATWHKGVIVDVVIGANNRILYAIKITDEGDETRRIMKVYDSELLEVTAELAPVKEPKRRVRAEVAALVWDDATIAKEVEVVMQNVGRRAKFLTLDGLMSGRIVTIISDRRVKKLLYRIELDRNDPNAAKTYKCKVICAPDLQIEDGPLDAIGERVRETYSVRHATHVAQLELTPVEKVSFAKKEYNKAADALTKAQTLAAQRKTDLAEAQAKLKKFLDDREDELLR